MHFYVVYGLGPDATERYEEQLLCGMCKTLGDVQVVINVAKKDGFHSFRVVRMKEELTFPDFTEVIEGSVRKKRRNKKR